MANEAVIIELVAGQNAVRRTCVDAVSISKGTICLLSGSNVVLATNAVSTGKAFGGIAAHDKIAGDGSTNISCWMDGVFDLTNALTAVTAIVAGSGVSMSGANLVKYVTAGELLTGALIGYSEEEAAVNDVFRVRLRGT